MSYVQVEKRFLVPRTFSKLQVSDWNHAFMRQLHTTGLNLGHLTTFVKKFLFSCVKFDRVVLSRVEPVSCALEITKATFDLDGSTTWWKYLQAYFFLQMNVFSVLHWGVCLISRDVEMTSASMARPPATVWKLVGGPAPSVRWWLLHWVWEVCSVAHSTFWPFWPIIRVLNVHCESRHAAGLNYG